MRRTFKDAVEKAVENGFDFNNWTLWDARYKVGSWEDYGNGFYLYIASGGKKLEAATQEQACFSYYRLLFGTDFIKYLVCGKRDRCYLYSTYCLGERSKTCDSFCEIKKEIGTGKCGNSTYRNENYKQDATYHLQQLALIGQDIEKLKEYVIREIMGEEK